MENVFPVPKPPKRARGRKRPWKRPYCENCGATGSGVVLELHCIYSKGGSGPGYIPENNVTLCVFPNDCHGKAQRYEIPREHLIALVAKRMRVSVEKIKKVLKERWL